MNDMNSIPTNQDTPPESAPNRSPRLTLRPYMVAAGLCLLYLIVIYLHYGTGLNEFIRPTTAGNAGYDGQFTYAIAIDPLGAAPYLDVPAYRYQRILHPLLARLLALGQAPLIPAAIVLINLIALAAGTAALETLLVAERVSRWYALVYGLFGGIFFAVRVSTNEPLAYALVLLAILAGQGKRFWLQALLLAFAAFAKETTLFFTAGYLLYFALERRWREVVGFVLIAVLPFVIWQIVLKSWLGQFGVGSGGAMATPFEVFPFNGIWKILPYGVGVFALLGIPLIPLVVIPTLWGLYRSARDAVQRRWHPYVFLLLANAAIMPFVPFSTYREPLGIARFLDGLVICILLYAALRKARGTLRYSTLWIVFGLRLLG